MFCIVFVLLNCVVLVVFDCVVLVLFTFLLSTTASSSHSQHWAWLLFFDVQASVPGHQIS